MTWADTIIGLSLVSGLAACFVIPILLLVPGDYPYTVKIRRSGNPRLRSRAIVWMKENCSGRWTFETENGETKALFGDESDAIAFKLWIEYIPAKRVSPLR